MTAAALPRAGLAAAAATFAADADRWQLRFRCRECAYVAPDGRCVWGWPNQVLQQEPFTPVAADGNLQFCKAFELDDG